MGIVKWLLNLLKGYWPQIKQVVVKVMPLVKRAALKTFKTKNTEQNTFDKLYDLIKADGGDITPGHPFLFGVRNEADLNRFNDVVGMLYWEDGKGKILLAKGTTDPGLKWTKSQGGGVARLEPGIHNGAWILGNRATFAKMAKTKTFRVFRQNGSKVWILRDQDRDGISDKGERREHTSREIQFHAMGFSDQSDGRTVGGWSAGCVGPMKISKYYKFIGIAAGYDKLKKKKQRYSFALFLKDDKRVPVRIREMAV